MGMRLSILAGIPGSTGGQVQLFIPREDRLGARRLVESITGTAPVGDREQARQEVAVTSAGLFITGVLALVTQVLAGVAGALAKGDEISAFWDPQKLLPVVISFGLVIVPLSALLITGAVLMRQIRGQPLVATAAIAAMVPWSPAW